MQKISKYFFITLIILMFSAIKVFASTPKILHENGLYIIKVKLGTSKIEPYVAENLETVFEIAQKTQAKIVINAGYFDGQNKKTVSFVTQNGVTLASPCDNENLITNKELSPHLTEIYNRAELRILNCEGKIKAQVTEHFSQIMQNCTIINSIQAGPMLLPTMNLEKEFFVFKKGDKILRDGAGMTRRTHRSLIATKGNHIYFIITDEHHPLTIYELQEKLLQYNFEQAINFDGGGSVSLFVKTKEDEFYQCREKNNTSRPIKSALIVY